MPLTFAQAQFIIAASAGVAPETLGRLTSRLKQWQKMDFPEGTRGVGKGSKAEYGAAQVFQLMLMMKLLKLGLTPDRAKEIISTGWDQFRHGILEALVSHGIGDGQRHYFVVQLDALSELTTPGAKHIHAVVDTVSEARIRAAWDPVGEERPEDEDWQLSFFYNFVIRNRFTGSFVIEVDTLLYWVAMCLREMGVAPTVFAAELNEWYDQVWKGYEGNQRDQEEFARFKNRSALDHDVGKVNLKEFAASAFSEVLARYGNGKHPQAHLDLSRGRKDRMAV